MDDGALQELEEAAVTLAQGAGEILLQRFGKPLEVTYKGERNQDPVTEADRASEEFLKDEISRRFPHHAIIAEETPESDVKSTEVVWVVDPLDGTQNYINGLPIFGVSIGVLEAGRPVVGALFIPSATRPGGSILHARVGGGAFSTSGESLRVADGEYPEVGRLAAYPGSFLLGYHLHRELRKRVGEVRATGSIVYEAAQVATGVFQYALIGRARLWDVVGGVVVVREAGGTALTRVKGRKGWVELERFEVSLNPDPGDLRTLRQWRAPVLLANPQVAWFVAQRLRPRGLQHLLRRWLRF